MTKQFNTWNRSFATAKNRSASASRRIESSPQELPLDNKEQAEIRPRRLPRAVNLDRPRHQPRMDNPNNRQRQQSQ
jgi:hypothetical protein